jgi:small subunit ribosomal protein S17
MPVKEKNGIVVSNKMQKTVVVKVESRYPHPIYSKTMIKLNLLYIAFLL